MCDRRVPLALRVQGFCLLGLVTVFDCQVKMLGKEVDVCDPPAAHACGQELEPRTNPVLCLC